MAQSKIKVSYVEREIRRRESQIARLDRKIQQSKADHQSEVEVFEEGKRHHTEILKILKKGRN